MFEIEAKFKSAKPNQNNEKSHLLVNFSTKSGDLTLIISSKQWMDYFVNDSQPEPGSDWKLRLETTVIPELSQTMLNLKKASPVEEISPTLATSNNDTIILWLNKIYQRMGDLSVSSQQQPSLSSLNNSDNQEPEDDFSAYGYNYQPNVDSVSSDEGDEEPLSDVKTPVSHDFNLHHRKKVVDPEKEALNQGTGSSITNSFFDDEDNQNEDDSESNNDAVLADQTTQSSSDTDNSENDTNASSNLLADDQEQDIDQQNGPLDTGPLSVDLSSGL